jgi:AraC-like DNA-binding protein
MPGTRRTPPPWLVRMVNDFATRLIPAVEAEVLGRLRATVSQALAPAARGRPPRIERPGSASERASERPPAAGAEPWVHTIKRLIDERYAEQLSLDYFAQQTGLSKFYVSRNFRKHVGRSIRQYHRRVRVERALVLLEQGKRPSAIAKQLGFADAAHMSGTFRAELGRPPGAFRRRV